MIIVFGFGYTAIYDNMKQAAVGEDCHVRGIRRALRTKKEYRGSRWVRCSDRNYFFVREWSQFGQSIEITSGTTFYALTTIKGLIEEI